MPQSKSKRSRYTPPAPKKAPPSRMWVPAAMFTCLALGAIVIVANYMELLPGPEPLNRYLMLGLVLLMAGISIATQVR